MAEVELPEFGEGDRVDHKKFGLGTIVDIDQNKIEVLFDESQAETKRVISSFLVKVSSPDARPFKFWDREWKPLRESWLVARRALEAAVENFRPAPDTATVLQLMADEKATWEAIQNFLEVEKNGGHGHA